MRCRRIVCKEHNRQIFAGARAAHVKQTPCPFKNCLFPLTLVSFVRLRRRGDTEKLSVGELVVTALLVINDSQNTAELSAFNPLMSRER